MLLDLDEYYLLSSRLSSDDFTVLDGKLVIYHALCLMTTLRSDSEDKPK